MYRSSSSKSHKSAKRSSNGGSSTNSNGHNGGNTDPSQRRFSTGGSAYGSERSLGAEAEQRRNSLNINTGDVRRNGSHEGEGSASSKSISSSSGGRQQQKQQREEERRERRHHKKSRKKNKHVKSMNDSDSLLLWDHTRNNTSDDDENNHDDGNKDESARERQKWRMSITEENLDITGSEFSTSSNKKEQRASYSNDFFYGEHLGLLEKRRRSLRSNEGLENNNSDDDHDSDDDYSMDQEQGLVVEEITPSYDDDNNADQSTLSQGTSEPGPTGAPYNSSVPVDAYDPTTMKRSAMLSSAKSLLSFRRSSMDSTKSQRSHNSSRGSKRELQSAKEGKHDETYNASMDTISYEENPSRNPSMMQKIQDKLHMAFPSSSLEHDVDVAHEDDYSYDYNPERHNSFKASDDRLYDFEKEEEGYDIDELKNRRNASKYEWCPDVCFRSSRRVGGIMFVFLLVGLAVFALSVAVEQSGGIPFLWNINRGGGSGGDDDGDDGKTHSTTIPIPPSTLAESCGTNKKECVLGCAPGSCCFMQPKSHPNNCFSKHEEICTLYEPCHTLLTDSDIGGYGGVSQTAELIYSSKSIVPEPPTNLPQICSLLMGEPGTMNAIVQSPTECRSACLTASCCLETGPNLNCATHPFNVQNCPIYKTHCSNLSPPMLDLSDYDGMIPPPPHNLRDICRHDNIISDEGKTNCEQACDVGLCCVGMGNQIDCALLPPAEKAAICMAYKRHCYTVWPSEVYAEEKNYIPLPLNQWCSTIDSKRKKQVCAEVCEDVKCCWEDGPSNCRSFNGDKCDLYSFCPDYHELPKEDLVDELIIPPIVLDVSIADRCTPLSIVDPENLEYCKSICAAGGCCLNSPSNESGGAEENDCSLEYGDICKLYQPCLDLPYDGWSTQVIPKSPIEYVCQSVDAFSTDEARRVCLDICSAGSCCYDDDLSKNCFANNEDICWLYEPCRTNAKVPAAPADLNKRCTFAKGDELGKEECIDACQPSACCWEGKNIGEDANIQGGLCYTANENTCSTYKPSCVIVEPHLGYGMGWQAESGLLPVLEACSSHNLETDEGLARCREECEPSWCCIAEDQLSCRNVYPQFCHKYEPICGPLLRLGILDIDDYETQDEDDVNTICSMKNVITVQGKERCEAECASASCCYVFEEDVENKEGQKKYSCRKEKAEWCEEMASCDVLIELMALTSNKQDGVEIDESTVLIPYAPLNIYTVCSPEQVSTFTGRRECEDTCLPSECCYEEETSGGCRQVNAGACDSYSPWCDDLVS